MTRYLIVPAIFFCGCSSFEIQNLTPTAHRRTADDIYTLKIGVRRVGFGLSRYVVKAKINDIEHDMSFKKGVYTTSFYSHNIDTFKVKFLVHEYHPLFFGKKIHVEPKDGELNISILPGDDIVVARNQVYTSDKLPVKRVAEYITIINRSDYPVEIKKIDVGDCGFSSISRHCTIICNGQTPPLTLKKDENCIVLLSFNHVSYNCESKLFIHTSHPSFSEIILLLESPFENSYASSLR